MSAVGAGALQRRRGRSGAVRSAGDKGTGPSPIRGFLLRLLCGWAIALGLIALFPGIERAAVRATVENLGFLGRLFPVGSAARGVSVSLGRTTFDIVPDCTPLMPTVALWTALLAFPSTLQWRLVGIVAGALAVWIYNLLRVLALFVVMARWPQAFDFIHVYLWQPITLLVVFALFALWLRLQPRAARAGTGGDGP